MRRPVAAVQSESHGRSAEVPLVCSGGQTAERRGPVRVSTGCAGAERQPNKNEDRRLSDAQSRQGRRRRTDRGEAGGRGGQRRPQADQRQAQQAGEGERRAGAQRGGPEAEPPLPLEERLGADRTPGHQRVGDALRNPAAHPRPVPRLPAGRPPAPPSLLRPLAERGLPGQEPGLLRRHPLLLPVRREATAARQRAPGHVPGGAALLRARGRGHQPLQGGRRLRQGGGEASAHQRPAAPPLDAVRVSRVVQRRPDHRHHQRHGHRDLHPHLLPGDAARVQEREGEEGAIHRRTSSHHPEPNRHGPAGLHPLPGPLLHRGDDLHLLVLLRARRALHLRPEQDALLQRRHEHHRLLRHHSLFRHARHRAGEGQRRAALRLSGPHQGHQAGEGLQDLQALAPLQGPPDPGPDAEGQSPRARPAHLLPLHRRHTLLQRRLLRRGGQSQHGLHQHPRGVLVGRGLHDDGRLRGHVPGDGRGKAGGLHVRHRRRADHLVARARHRVQLQLLLPPRNGVRGHDPVPARLHVAVGEGRRGRQRGRGRGRR